MSGQTQPETALQSLAAKLRTDAIAIFGEGQAERDIFEWFYGSLLAAAPAVKAEQELCEFHGDDSSACRKYSGKVPCEPAPVTPAAQGAVPDAQAEPVGEREAFEAWVKTFNSMPAALFVDDRWRYVDDWIQCRWLGWQARAALLASTGQEVGK